ncbi:MAG: hypothetical protein WCD79_15580, partial [Chthoniobacteraceae bacterium]
GVQTPALLFFECPSSLQSSLAGGKLESERDLMKKLNLYIIVGVSSQLLLGAACAFMMLDGDPATPVVTASSAAIPGRQLFPDSANSAGMTASSHEMEPRDVQPLAPDSTTDPTHSALASNNSLPTTNGNTNGNTQSSLPAANFSSAAGYPQNFTNTNSAAPLQAVVNSTNPSFQAQVAVPVKEPLAIQPVDPVAVGLSGGQQAVVEAIAQDFQNNVGGENQNPNDPTYLKRWQAAQPTSDDVMRESLGDSAYFQYVASAALAKLGKPQ